MSPAERTALKSAEQQIRTVVRRLREAADAIDIKDEPAESKGRRRHDEITLLGEEVEDLAGRLGVLLAG